MILAVIGDVARNHYSGDSLARFECFLGSLESLG